jgi:transketolase
MAEIVKRQDHRREFIDTLIELAEKDEKIVLIVPDVGFNYIEEFQKRFPNRYFNFGVTEQSVVMIATGMALAGFKPYVYSMINFVLFRPAEMVRNGIVCHNANVKLLGVKGSASYKFLGFSHNLIHDKEDFNFCDNIGLQWEYPQDNHEVRQTILDTYQSGKSAYIRL